VTTVLVGLTGFNERRQDAQTDPPRGPWGQPGEGVGGERHAGVGANPPRQAKCFESTQEYWLDLRAARR
jgi:hypothetical protein